ncbi:MAG: ADP-ribosylglycohydrolase family protein [Chloroflexota bacterium]|nr:ADP-ribosylglycohydrolase family protein [Chloroflexota bacterium]
MAGDATQDRFLGAILGMAIGDAFGMPVQGLSPATIQDFHGSIVDFLPRTFANGDLVGAGEITDDTELALCIIESITVGEGVVDVENIGIRMNFLARSDSQRWMSAEVREALDGASEDAEYRLPLRDDAPAGPDILSRGIPIGLMHSLGPLDNAKLRSEVDALTRITHASPLALSLVEAVARAVSHAARQSVELGALRSMVAAELPDGAIRLALGGEEEQGQAAPIRVLLEALGIVASADAFDGALQQAVMMGGAADTRAALVGALFGGYHGSAVIPQRLIDGLEARIYVSLAVPWFYRTVARRSGRALDLRLDRG